MENLTKDLFNSATDYLYITDKSGVFFEVNPSFCNALKIPHDAIIGKKMTQFMDRSYQILAERCMRQIIEKRKQARSTRVLKSASGELFSVECVENPLIRNGEVWAISGIARDITQEEILENKLWNSVDHGNSALDFNLRTSIGLTKGYIYTLAQTCEGADEKFGRYVKVIEDEIEGLSRNIEDLLDHNSIESGLQITDNEVVSVTDCLEQACTELEDEINNREVQLLINIPEKQVWLYAPKEALRRIFVNLIFHSIQHTLHNGIISVTILDTEEYIDITISDNGTGMPDEELKYILDKAYYTKSMATSQYSTGLGLAITKIFVIALGGKIGVKSKVGQGTEFSVVLPKRIVLNENYNLNSLQAV